MYGTSALPYIFRVTRCVSRARTTPLSVRPRPQAMLRQRRLASIVPIRPQTTSRVADEKVEEITELFATAKDEVLHSDVAFAIAIY